MNQVVTPLISAEKRNTQEMDTLIFPENKEICVMYHGLQFHKKWMFLTLHNFVELYKQI